MKELCAVSKECKGVCRIEREVNRKKPADTCPAWYLEENKRRRQQYENEDC